MMSPQTITMMILIPVVVAGVLALCIMGGRMSAMTRTRVELIFLGLFYPVMIAFWTWRTIDAAGTDDWLMGVLAGGLAVAMGIQGVVMARKRVRALRVRA